MAIQKIDVTLELTFKTSRSGGKGGQNVNKVETKVEARWKVAATKLFLPEQIVLITTKLANQITDDGDLILTCTEDRTQLGNKQKVIKKINSLVQKCLVVPKKRKPTEVPAGVKEKRLTEKKRVGEIKSNRKKPEEE